MSRLSYHLLALDNVEIQKVAKTIYTWTKAWQVSHLFSSLSLVHPQVLFCVFSALPMSPTIPFLWLIY